MVMPGFGSGLLPHFSFLVRLVLGILGTLFLFFNIITCTTAVLYKLCKVFKGIKITTTM